MPCREPHASRRGSGVGAGDVFCSVGEPDSGVEGRSALLRGPCSVLRGPRPCLYDLEVALFWLALPEHILHQDGQWICGPRRAQGIPCLDLARADSVRAKSSLQENGAPVPCRLYSGLPASVLRAILPGDELRASAFLPHISAHSAAGRSHSAPRAGLRRS